MAEGVQELDQLLLRLRRRRARRKLLLGLVSLVVIFSAGFILFRGRMGLIWVEGESMAPTLRSGDIILYVRTGSPMKYGDMILLEPEDGELIVKRVVGLPGDVLDLTLDGHLTRNGTEIDEPEVRYGLQDSTKWVLFPYIVPEGSIFYLGDNRPRSLDSRILGPALEEQIIGKVVFSLRAAP